MTIKYKVGIDIGGTFTDIVFVGDDRSASTHKTLSTPDDYSRGIITGMQEIIDINGIEASDIERVVHACTIVTNACIELTGAKIGLITTKGFYDILEITRGRMPVMYDLLWSKPVPFKTNMKFKQGDIIRLVSSGAGGWGDPLERDVERVRDDVHNEKISIQRAKDVYGVVINEATLNTNVSETQKLRKVMKRGEVSNQ